MPAKAARRKRTRRKKSQGISSIKLFFSRFFQFILALIFLAIALVIIFWLYFAFFVEFQGLSKNILIGSAISDQEKATNYVLVLRSDQNSAQVISFDRELMIPIIGDYGDYPMRSVLPLLELEKKDNQFIRSVFSFGLDFYVSDVITSKDEITLSSPKQVDKLVQDLVFSSRLKNNISLTDRLKILSFINSLREDQKEIIQVNSTEQWDRLVSKELSEYQEPECKVAVINTTVQSGLATKIALILESNGSSIIRIDDSNLNQEKSSILINPNTKESCSLTLESSKNVFPFHPQVKEDILARDEYRADLVILAGQDMDQLW